MACPCPLIIIIIIYLRGFALKVVLFTFEISPSRLFYLPSRLRPQGCFIYLRGFTHKVVLFTIEVSPSRLFYLPSRLRPQGCVNFASEALPSVFFWAFIGLAGASTFCLTWLVPAHWLLLLSFTFEVSPSRLFYLPSRFRPQGCFIYLRGFALKVVLFTFEV